ncbi:MAG: glycoside hydrolase family 3 C-terminal domain-containing protein [Bacteroidales bacterium]|nr:glycoside hydrolase family 3 C-terminal domain-containing protein [Bacteroidales bacterium]
MIAGCTPRVQPVTSPDSEIERKVEKTLSSMTTEEKVGQMIQLVADLFGHNDENGVFVMDTEKLDSIFTNYKVGSILNAPNTMAPTAAQWEGYIATVQESSVRCLGIPCIFGLDQNHGSTYTQGGTLFPQNINLGATFNRELARAAAEATAYEARAISVPWTFCPTLDLGRDPRWSRIWENFGEDCYVNAEMGRAQVLGFQGEDHNHIDNQHIAVSLKHYLGYGVPYSGKDRTPACISPAELREKHFAPYLAGISAGALSIMVNSSSVNGMPVHANRELLTGWLKEETGWDGVLITDWNDINNLYTREMVAGSQKEAIRIAINAGIDMIMEPYHPEVFDVLMELINEKAIPMKRIDDAARRVLRMKYRLGLFDAPQQKLADYPDFGGEKFARLALEGAEESMVLLKNENSALPLKNGARILLTGPNANSMRCLNGGWSYTWQGHLADSFASNHNTIYEAFCNRFGKENVILEQGVTYFEAGKYYEENTPDIASAVKAAARADVIVACIGENSYCETPGNLTDLNLSENQRNLVKALAATGKPIVLILSEGRPRLIADIEPLADAVVDILLPGNYGGDALARLVAGDANFSGKLPYTYPKEINSLVNYDFKKSQEVETMAGAYDYDARVTVQWGFGFGLSYTTFAYSNLTVDKSSFTADDTLHITVDVTNTGSRAGKEAVLLYSSDIVAGMVPDGRRLRAFDKIYLEPGQTQTVSFELAASDLAYVGYDGHWVIDEGDFTLQTGNQTAGITCSRTKRWDTPNR